MTSIEIGENGYLTSPDETKNFGVDPLDEVNRQGKEPLLNQTDSLPMAHDLKMGKSDFEDDAGVQFDNPSSEVVTDIDASTKPGLGVETINMAKVNTLENESRSNTTSIENSTIDCRNHISNHVAVDEVEGLSHSSSESLTTPRQVEPSDENGLRPVDDSAVVEYSSTFRANDVALIDDTDDKASPDSDEPVALIHSSRTPELSSLSDVMEPEVQGRTLEINKMIETDLSNSTKQPPLSNSEMSSSSNYASSTNVGKKLKACSGFINKCIDNLRLRGLEMTAGPCKTKDSDFNSNVEAGIFNSTLTDGTDSSDSIIRGLISRSHRKSRKPTRVPYRARPEVIDLCAATKSLQFSCSTCTFTCNTAIELAEHVSLCHTGKINNDANMFSCSYCKTPAKNREQLRIHLAHHTGNHVFRCFTCPYCSIQADHMDTMDNHIGLLHPSEDFRFEVSQERVTHLQNMLECPVCNAAFSWKNQYIDHFTTVHNLKNLASHLDSQFPEMPLPTSCRVSVHLFEEFADKVSESVKQDEDSSLNDDDESQIESKDGENKHFGTSSEYVLNMEKIVDELFRNKEPDFSDKDDFFKMSDHGISQAAKGITKDVWFSSDGGQKGVDIKSFGSVRDSLPPMKALSVRDLPVPQPESGINEWRNYAEVLPAAGDDSDVNSNNFDADEAQEIMSSNSKRAILRCNLCPFVCNRAPNFRRHLAIHERQSEYADGYKCAYCHFQHRRLNVIRFHLGKYHNHLPARICRIVGGAQISEMEADEVVPCADSVVDNLSVSSESEDFSSVAYKKQASDDLIDISNSPNANVISPDSLGREKRLSKPPKRLSETLEFQSPVSSLLRPRRTSIGNFESTSPYQHGDNSKNCSSPFDLAADDRRTESPLKSCSSTIAGKPFDDSISVDFYASTLPPGMIYQKPLKCPRCDFTNRVRINLVRHMKQHHMEDELDDKVNFSEMHSDKFPMTWNAKNENEMPVPLLSYETKRSDGLGSHRVVVKSEPTDHVGVWNKPHADDGIEMLVHQRHRERNSSSPRLHGGSLTSISKPWKTNHEQLSTRDMPHSHRKRSALFAGLDGELSNDNDTRNIQNIRSGDHNQTYDVFNDDNSQELDFDTTDGDAQNQKRLFKCAYCSVSSRWNRRDISLHVLHVHIRRRAFRCRRCGYSTSKSASAVTVHCARTHPGKPAIIEDNLAILNSILPVHARPGLVHVAFRRPDGAPEMNVRELERFFGLSPETVLPEKQPPEDRVQSLPKRVMPPVIQKSSTMVSNLPLDLSAPVTSRKSTNNLENNVTSPVIIDSQSPRTFIPIKREPIGGSRLTTDNNVVLQRANNTGVAPLDLQTAHKLELAVQKPKPATQASPNAAFYRCRQCGYQDLRHDKTKYHVVREHLHLGPYGCVYCPRYMWGRRHVARHIDATHPGMPIKIRRAFDEFETYLRQNIRKIGGLPERTKRGEKNVSPIAMSTQLPPDIIQLDLRSTSNNNEPRPNPKPLLTENASEVPSSNRIPHIVYQCGHCEFRDSLAARVQGHCLAKHPSKPVRFRRCEAEHGSQTSFASSSSEATTGLKIQSVESLSTNRGRTAFHSAVSSAPTSDNYCRSQMKTGQSDHWNTNHVSGQYGQINCEDSRKNIMETSSYSAVDSESIHSSEDDEDVDGVFSDGLPMYVCLYCPEVACSEEEIRMHVRAIHPGQPLKYGNAPHRSETPGITLNKKNVGGESAEILSTDEEEENDGKGASSGAFIYRCKLCRYRSDKVTVVRHHVMAHLLYHPYRCPYCDTVRSVKSSPITKHIRGRHPGREQSFICNRDENLERQVRKNYYRSEPNELVDSLPPPPPIARRAVRQAALMEPQSTIICNDRASISPEMGANFDEASGTKRMNSARRSFYRCKFCGLTTHVRTDMRHHLMREIGYKPFRCAHCYAAGANYAEPSRSAMGKHFRMRHSGMTVEVHDLSDPARESEVFDLLDSSMVDEDAASDDANPPPIVTGGAVKRMHSNVQGIKTATIARPLVLPTAIGAYKMNEKTSIQSRIPDPPVVTREYISDAEVTSNRRLRIGPVHLRRCQHCSYTSKSPKALAQHIAVRHRPRGLRCAYCDHTAHYPSWLRKHSQKSHPNMPFKFIQIGGDRFNMSSSAAYEGLPLTQEEALIEPWGSETALASGEDKSDAGSRDGSGSVNGSSVSILLDGAEVNIPLVADPIGLYHCPVCAYQTSNKAHFKMHFMIHRPRKWQCIYCRLKFPLLFRLRHHYTTNHPGLPVQWRDLTTGQLCDQSTNLSSSVPSTSLSSTCSPVSMSAPVPIIEKQFTARKSMSRSALRVAMFRCGQFFSIRRVEASSPKPNGNESDVSNDDDDYSMCSSFSASLVMCCHICRYRTDVVDSLWRHLKTVHCWGRGMLGTRYPSVELLPEIDVAHDEFTGQLQQCGFCEYMTLDNSQFGRHVEEVHEFAPPLVCTACRRFASFSRNALKQHFSAEHSTDSEVGWQLLSEPYTMRDCSSDEVTNHSIISFCIDPYLILSDISSFIDS